MIRALIVKGVDMQIRPYQETLKADIRAKWAEGHQNILAVASTGSGKTKIFSDLVREHAKWALEQDDCD